MMILITYDVETQTLAGQRRLRRVAKECQNYGIRVQNSVFECVLNNAQFLTLKDNLDTIIDKNNDSIRMYHLGKNWQRHIETLGVDKGINIASTLII